MPPIVYENGLGPAAFPEQYPRMSRPPPPPLPGIQLTGALQSWPTDQASFFNDLMLDIPHTYKKKSYLGWVNQWKGSKRPITICTIA